jgi:hypothetical protein
MVWYLEHSERMFDGYVSVASIGDTLALFQCMTLDSKQTYLDHTCIINQGTRYLLTVWKFASL